MRDSLIKKIENEPVSNVYEDTDFSHQYVKDYLDLLDSTDKINDVILDKSIDVEEIVDFRMYKQALLKSLKLIYNSKKEKNIDSLKYLEIFILLNGIMLPEEYSYLLEDKYNIPSNYELSLADYSRMFNVSRQAVSAYMIELNDFIFKLSKACYSRSNSNIINNIKIIIDKLPVSDISINNLIDILNEDELDFLSLDYITYCVDKDNMYERYCKRFNISIRCKYVELLDEKKLLYLVLLDTEEDVVKRVIYKTIFNKIAFRKVFITFNDNDRTVIERYFNSNYNFKNPSNHTKEIIDIFLSLYIKEIDKSKRDTKKKKEEVKELIDNNIEEEIKRITASAKKLAKELDISNKEKNVLDKSDNEPIDKLVVPSIQKFQKKKGMEHYYSVLCNKYNKVDIDIFTRAFYSALDLYMTYLLDIEQNKEYYNILVNELQLVILNNKRYKDVEIVNSKLSNREIIRVVKKIETTFIDLINMFCISEKNNGNTNSIFEDIDIIDGKVEYSDSIKNYLSYDFINHNSNELNIMFDKIDIYILKEYISKLNEKELYDIFLNKLRNPKNNFFSFNFDPKLKLLSVTLFMQPTFQQLYEQLKEPNKAMIRLIFTGVGDITLRKIPIKSSLDKYRMVFISFWNEYNGYFNDIYIEKHGNKKL